MNYPQFIGFSTLTLIVLLAGYSVQIFADFAGYSLIAIGLASLFGYKLPDNFNYPYLSSSLGEFWRRWHISLSGWLRDYLYFPLGGNRRGRLRTYFNLFLVMAIGGLWHGAAWSFVIWGLYHGLGLAFERWAEERWPDLSLRLPRWACVATVFIFVSFGWLLFRLPDFGHVIAYLRCLATNYSLGFVGQKKLLILVFVFSLPVFLLHAFKSMAAGGRIHCVASTVPAWLKYGLLVFAILVSYGLPGAFIYFQF
jgi:alginate O-acetyltransferase complex protein AlgI